MILMRHEYGYEADESADGPEFGDTQPGEPVFDYGFWPPDSEAVRDENLRRLGRLTWRATLLSAVGAAAFAILFVRSAPAHTTATSQKVVRPAGTLTPSAATPTPSPRHRRHKARTRGADGPAPAPTPGAAVAPTGAAPSSPTLAPPTTPPAPSPSPSPAQSTSSGSTPGG